MDSKNILTADLLDLVFDNRNKDYGAYELRLHYNRRIGKALVITATIIGISFTSIALANKWQPKEEVQITQRTVTIIELPPDEKPIPKPVQPEPVAAKPVELVRTEKFTAFQIVDTKDNIDPPPTQQDLQVAAVGTSKQDGPEDAGLPPIEKTLGQGKGIIDEPAPKNDEPISIVQVQAKFIGNWEKFLTRNLNPNTPVDNGAAPGRYTVLVQFVVDIDGSVSDIRPLSSMGFGMEAEAIRVLKKATKWEPAIQNGHQVKAYRKQPITFVVSEE